VYTLLPGSSVYTGAIPDAVASAYTRKRKCSARSSPTMEDAALTGARRSLEGSVRDLK
jgi:hypothetical protein